MIHGDLFLKCYLIIVKIKILNLALSVEKLPTNGLVILLW